jgi:hypothetical protein
MNTDPLFECPPALLDALRKQGAAAQHPAIVDLALRALGPDALYVQRTADPDGRAHAAAALARQCGPAAVAAVDAALAATDDAAAWGDALAAHAGNRPLLVEAPLREPDPDRDALAALLAEPWPWERPALAARTLVVATGPVRLGALGVRPRPDGRWSSDALWRVTDHDPNRYALALACALALDQAPPRELLRDDALLVDHLLRRVPDGLADLLGLLHAHGRPVDLAHLRALGLVDPARVDDAVEARLVEVRRGLVVLPRALAARPEAAAVTALRRRRWAEAFAAAARDPRPELDARTARAEAHRHYAAIADAPAATATAPPRGHGVLLALGVDQERAGDRAGAARTYARVLPALPATGRLRAWVEHHLHDCRAGSGDEPVAETLAGLRRASEAWPENAAFAARLIEALFAGAAEDEALQHLQRAWGRASPPAAGAELLLHGLVRRLMARGRPLEALVAASAAPAGAAMSETLEDRLLARLERPWTTRRFWAPGLAGAEVGADARCTLSQRPEGPWVAEVDGATREGEYPLEAWAAMVRAIRFRQLALRWQTDTRQLGARAEKFEHAAYAEILTMGHGVAPEILRWLAEGHRGHWDEALAQLTGTRPPLPKGAVAPAQVRAAWVEWGRASGLIARDAR